MWVALSFLPQPLTSKGTPQALAATTFFSDLQDDGDSAVYLFPQ
jgi:hypothetical protein